MVGGRGDAALGGSGFCTPSFGTLAPDDDDAAAAEEEDARGGDALSASSRPFLIGAATADDDVAAAAAAAANAAATEGALIDAYGTTSCSAVDADAVDEDGAGPVVHVPIASAAGAYT